MPLLLPELSPLNACETPKKGNTTYTHTNSYTRILTVNDARMRVCVHPPTTHMCTCDIHMHLCASMCNVPLAPLIKCQCELSRCFVFVSAHMVTLLSLSLTLLRNSNKKTTTERVLSKFASNNHTRTLLQNYSII